MPRMSRFQKKIIREWARRLAGAKNVTAELGVRYYTGDDPQFKDWESWNLASPPAPPDDDTDLAHTLYWQEVVTLDLPPDCDLDFYIYTTGPSGELKINMGVRFRAGRLVEIFETGFNPKWIKWQGSIL